MLNVLVNGAFGRMGRAMGAGINSQEDMQVIAAVDVKGTGSDIGILYGCEPLGIVIEEDLSAAINRVKPDVVLEFTNVQAVMKSIRTTLALKTPCVVGSTGLGETDLAEIRELAKKYNTPVFIAANFALGAVLMMRFSKEAAKYFPNIEVIERHHDNKLDAPSGTAGVTLEMMSEVREVFAQGAPNEFERIPGSRGGDYQGMRVHSVRLPGYLASQEVLFGGTGQVLTIRHDTINHNCFLPGVLLALRKVSTLKGLVCGLENIM